MQNRGARQADLRLHVLFDAMVDYALAAIFQECGHEVSFANIELPQGASDEDIALWAHDRAAFMLSCDRDMRGIINKQSRGQNPYYLVSRINFVQVDEGRQPDRLRAALPVIEYLRKLTSTEEDTRVIVDIHRSFLRVFR